MKKVVSLSLKIDASNTAQLLISDRAVLFVIVAQHQYIQICQYENHKASSSLSFCNQVSHNHLQSTFHQIQRRRNPPWEVKQSVHAYVNIMISIDPRPQIDPAQPLTILPGCSHDPLPDTLHNSGMHRGNLYIPN